MAIVNFKDIKENQIYITRGGTAVINNSGKIVGWGYDRIKVIKKTPTTLIVQTPWGTTCVLNKDYPLFSTIETSLRIEFKLITKYISKQEIPFDTAVKLGICTEKLNITEKSGSILENLIEYFNVPQSISSAAKKFNISYQKVRYILDKIEIINKYKIIRKDSTKGKTVYIKRIK